MQDRGDLHSRPLTTASGSDTASIEASCNAAIAKKYRTDILANGKVVPLAPRSTPHDILPYVRECHSSHRQLLQQRLRLQKIARVEAFGKPPVDRNE
jgi:hypothetical protein